MHYMSRGLLIAVSRLEALRNAQLTILNRYDPSTRDLRLRRASIVPDSRSTTGTGRCPPRYRAASVLSGDWR